MIIYLLFIYFIKVKDSAFCRFIENFFKIRSQEFLKNQNFFPHMDSGQGITAPNKFCAWIPCAEQNSSKEIPESIFFYLTHHRDSLRGKKIGTGIPYGEISLGIVG